MSFLCEWQSNFVPLKRCPFLLELASQTSPVVKRRPLLINAINFMLGSGALKGTFWEKTEIIFSQNDQCGWPFLTFGLRP